MKKLFKIIASLVVLAFVLIVVAVVILPMVINPNDFKPQIVEAVKQQTGRDLKIEGDLGLSVFPKIGLTLGKTELSNATGFGDTPFASMNAVNIQVAFIPLLDKQVEMDEIVVQGLSLNMKRNKDGKTNWDDLAAKKTEDKKKPTPTGKPEAAELQSISIGGIRIEDANILWQDDQQGTQYKISHFNLISGPLTSGEVVDIELNTEFSSKAPQMQGQLGLTGVVQANEAGNEFSIKQFVFDLDAKGKELPAGQAKLAINADILSVNLQQQTLTLTNLIVSTLGLTVNGNISGQQILADTPQFNGKLSIAEFNAREVIKALGQPAPQMADNKALTRVSVDFDLAASTQQASLNNLKIVLDDTNLNGKLAITDFASQAVTFDLNIDQIDLDRYLPAPDSAAASPAKEKTAAPSAEAELFPIKTLRKLNANGTARIGLLKKMNVTATDIIVTLKAKGGHIKIKPSATLYQGKYNAKVVVDARSNTPKLKVVSKLKGVQIEPLLKDMQGEAKLAGSTNADINITANGNTQTAIKKTLNGNTAFSFTDGALVGVNIAKVIREGMAKFKGKPLPETNEPEKTDFSVLSGTAKITNGVLNNRDLSMKSPLLRLAGAGKVNLVQENLDYLLKASIVGSLQGTGGEDLEKLKGVTIPIRVKGPLSNPSYKPDLSAALSDSVKQKAKEKVDTKKDEVKENFKDKLKDKFKGLF